MAIASRARTAYDHDTSFFEIPERPASSMRAASFLANRKLHPNTSNEALMKTYTAAVASKATQTPIPRMQTYFERNHIVTQPCDVPSKGCGDKRGYSLRTIRQIGMTTQLGWLGIGPSRAAEAAFAFAHKANPGREVGELYPLGRTILVGYRSGQNKIVNIAPDESLDKLFEQDSAAFLLDCGKIVREIQTRMDKN